MTDGQLSMAYAPTPKSTLTEKSQSRAREFAFRIGQIDDDAEMMLARNDERPGGRAAVVGPRIPYQLRLAEKFGRLRAANRDQQRRGHRLA